MASPTTNAACICPENSDSALSTTANILSILTFAYVIVLGNANTFTVRWTSSGDVLEVRSDVADMRK